MIKSVLAFPPFYLESMYNLPPLGLINLATSLEGLGGRTVILDFALAIRQKTLRMGSSIYDDCAERILEEDPDLLAVSVQCTTFPAVIQIIRRIKTLRGDVKIVLGGHTVSFVDKRVLEQYPFVDAVVRGEGERSFRELVQNYALGGNGEGVDGVTFRRGQEVIQNRERPLIACLDDLPLPDYRFAPSLRAYRDACELPRSIAILEVGRGCPHRCIYCSQSRMWRRKSRTFSIERLVTEMGTLQEQFGAECFLLAYDQFTSNRPFVESFCRRIIEKGLNRLPWYCISRLDSVDRPLLALMREAGCESMCYGIDSGSKRTLAFIRKKIDEKILYERVRETAEQGIIPTLSFVIGFPEEEKEDLDKTLHLALQSGVVGNSHPLVQMLTVLPGTDLHARYKDRLVREVDTYFSLGLEFDEGKRLASDEALIESSREFFSTFYNLSSPGRTLEELKLIADDFPFIVRFYPKSFLLLASELKESISDLFLRWLSWQEKISGRADLFFSPREGDHFSSFVSAALADKPPRHAHLCDLLKYETLSLEAASCSEKKGNFEIDIHRLRGCRPVRNREIVIGEFDFDLQPILDDLKEGRLEREYPREKTYLVFAHEGEILDVSSINAFGWDFLRLSDGNAPLEEISRTLYPRYGQGLSREDFLTSCEEAVQVLAGMGLLNPSSGPDSPTAGMKGQAD
jgi:radical SAM superfamily enzyme YgiQ (UPF0313 family)